MEVAAPKIKKGYRQTEVGVIPEDWGVKTCGELGYFYKGKGISSRDLVVDGVPCIMYGDIYVKFQTKFNRADFRITRETALKSSRANKGDLFFTGSGETAEDIGKCVVYLGDTDLYIGGDIIAMTPYEGMDSLFLAYTQNTPLASIQKASLAQGHTVVHIYSSHIKSLKVAVPPTDGEQKKIAEALSDTDSLIQSLDALIEKKKNIKTATMQQLLTGKTRLPGFGGEWKFEKLGSYSEMGSGGTPLSTVQEYYGGNIPWVSISDMTKGGKVISKTERYLTQKGFDSCAAQIFPVGSVLYAMYASLGECSIAAVPMCSSQAILGIRTKKDLNNEFLYYYLTFLKPSIKSLGQQGTQSNLNKKMVQDLLIPLPSESEQTSIVEVISEIDYELELLQKRRDKLIAIKQGMMHELLTGNTRLV